MAHETNEFQPAQQSRAAQHPNDAVVQERVQELTWSMLDEQLSDDEFQLLDNLLLSDDEARRTYLGCVQLHAGLIEHFRAPVATAGAAGTLPVLGVLSLESPEIGIALPSAEDAKS